MCAEHVSHVAVPWDGNEPAIADLMQRALGRRVLTQKAQNDPIVRLPRDQQPLTSVFYEHSDEQTLPLPGCAHCCT